MILPSKANNTKRSVFCELRLDRIQLLIFSSLTLALFGPWVRRLDRSTTTGAVMNEVKATASLGMARSEGSDATRRLCEQGQSVAKTINEWNTEVSQFLRLLSSMFGSLWTSRDAAIDGNTSIDSENVNESRRGA